MLWHRRMGKSTPMPIAIGPTMEEQGIQFYMNHYLLNLPKEPSSQAGQKTLAWLFHPALQDVMAAVGLAALSNLNGDAEMSDLSRKKYVSAMSQTGKLIMRPTPADAYSTLRTVVMLALFEVRSDFCIFLHLFASVCLRESNVLRQRMMYRSSKEPTTRQIL